jgi:hypothetical protein
MQGVDERTTASTLRVIPPFNLIRDFVAPLLRG